MVITIIFLVLEIFCIVPIKSGDNDSVHVSLREVEGSSCQNNALHGIERLIERGFNAQEVKDLIHYPTSMTIQSDGSKVFIKQISVNRFNMIAINEITEKVITCMKSIDNRALKNLGKKYGWK